MKPINLNTPGAGAVLTGPGGAPLRSRYPASHVPLITEAEHRRYERPGRPCPVCAAPTIIDIHNDIAEVLCDNCGHTEPVT